MKKILAIVFCLLLFLPGCGVIIVDRLCQTMERMAELQAKIEKERRAQSYTIEGVVKCTETFKVLREIEAAKHMDKEIQELRRQKEVKEFKTEKEYSVFVVTFEDGREKEFRSIPAKPLEKGVYIIITYNGMDEITGVQRK